MPRRKKFDEDEEEVGRIICQKCGSDLVPQQPSKSARVLCKKCHKWVDNTGKIRRD
jgi:DNA-directed RNA polymerase subunit M/transcription elongation factor TFIIS